MVNIARTLLDMDEAVQFTPGGPDFKPEVQNPRNIDAKPPAHHPGQVYTHLNYGKSLSTRGQPDPRGRFRDVVNTNLVPVDVGGVNPRVMTISAYTHTGVPAADLDRLKSLDWPTSQAMIDHAADYLSNAVALHHFDFIIPVPSSKRGASTLASAIGDRLGVPVNATLFDKVAGVNTKGMGTGAWSRYKANKYVRTSTPVDGFSFLVVDDLSTTQSSIVEIASMLYKEGAKFVGAAVLSLQQGSTPKSRPGHDVLQPGSTFVRP